MDCDDDSDVDDDYGRCRNNDSAHNMEVEHPTNQSTPSIKEIVTDPQNASSQKKYKRHGAKNQHKMKYFVQWIHETFLNRSDTHTTSSHEEQQRSPPTPHCILDVAGGKGELAARLVMCCRNIHVTLVDPRKADIAAVYQNGILPRLPKKWQEQYVRKSQENTNFIQEILTERYRQYQMYFTTETVNGTDDDTLRQAIEACTLMIGMHADSATECIVDMALQYHKPFVVVPCCVFPNFFPQRFLSVKVSHENGNDITKQVPVRTYEQFCDYLFQKDARFQRTVLPFDGRNIAIWWNGH